MRPARGYRDFCARAGRTYDALETPFLRGTRPTPLSLVTRGGLRGLPALARISPFASLWDALGSSFPDPRLRQLFGRYATYCGSSPWQAPATLMLVAHVEQQGVWLVQGGMHQLALMLARLAVTRGARIRYGAKVARIESRDGRPTGVRLVDGERIEADAVVFNGDVAALSQGLLGPEVAAAQGQRGSGARSLSALTLNLLARTDGFPLLRHSVFFSNDYAAEFRDIFQGGTLPRAPTVYLCAQDRSAHDAPAPEWPERLLCIVNAPACGDTHVFTPKEVEPCERQIFQLLARCGLQVTVPPGGSHTTTPTGFEAMFPGTGGALYGQASHGWMASFSRPGSRSAMPGLYLAGGSTHPGPGG
ncbi:MAG: CrtD protein [Comamonadaceae bacterium]|nr:MAG: CrtD protein [Comamonadaceae bacterium]